MLESGRRGFTIIELLVAIGIILALMGITIPTLTFARHRASHAATASLVAGVATAIENQKRRVWTVVAPPSPGSTLPSVPWQFPIWDVNRDQYIDGRPGLETDVDYPAAILGDPRYTGFVDLAGADVPKRFVNARRQVVDAWGGRLRLAYAVDTYGASGFGVWSEGRNRRTEATGGDDLTSWGAARE